MSGFNLAQCTVAVSDTLRGQGATCLKCQSMCMVPTASDSRKGGMLMGVAPHRVMWDHLFRLGKVVT